MSSNSVSALRLDSVIHSGGLFFYRATHRKSRGTLKKPRKLLSVFGAKVVPEAGIEPATKGL